MITPTMALAGINFASEFLQGLKAAEASKQYATQYANQAAVARQNAATVRQNGAINEDTMRSSQRAEVAEQRAAAGEAGMAESPTTALAVATTAAKSEQNILTERYKVENEAENYLYQARVADENARVQRKKARNLFTNSVISGIGNAFSLM
jgi:hypothetical protein